MHVYLLLETGPGDVALLWELSRLLVVGRHRFNDIVVSSPRMSRRHAELFTDQGVPYVRDLSANHLTFVNGRRLTSSAPYALDNDDVVSFGVGSAAVSYRVCRRRHPAVRVLDLLGGQATSTQGSTAHAAGRQGT
ncbi:MAG: FHA domain-containing protein [Candidatus Schekmanbacteria bacterium]|nr:FHA domain-containing protein [Candidatus Schekmanbacteria bacterium]